MTNVNFWDSEVWGFLNLIGVLLVSLLIANALKRTVGFLRKSLIPTSVLAGGLLLIVSVIFRQIAGVEMFDSPFFSQVVTQADGTKEVVLAGSSMLEILTYHMLALGFIAITFKPAKEKTTKRRSVEIFNTGLTTVATYLIQAALGIALTLLVAALFLPDFFPGAGVLLCFGFGQGTGQALNYGNIYELWGTTHPGEAGFVGGRSFGLAIAALGFLSASLGGVIALNVLRKRRTVNEGEDEACEALVSEAIQSNDEIPMNGSIDKLTVQIAIVSVCYLACYGVMALLGNLLGEGLRAVVFGFNFLFGVLFATLFKGVNNLLLKKHLIKRQHINPFLMQRIGGFCFDLMIVAGIGAIRFDVLRSYWWILLLLSVVGALVTFAYNRFVAKKLFPRYADEQFLAMYGMLTGTASSGLILLREIDPEFRTPVSENLVYQNLPAIIFGFPLMLIAPMVPGNPVLVMILMFASFAAINVILFRRAIFCRRRDRKKEK